MAYSFKYDHFPTEDTYHGRGGRSLISIPNAPAYTFISSDPKWLHYQTTPNNILVWADINKTGDTRIGTITFQDQVYTIIQPPFTVESHFDVTMVGDNPLTSAGGSVTFLIDKQNVGEINYTITGLTNLTMDTDDDEMWSLTIPSTESTSQATIVVTFTTQDILGNEFVKSFSIVRKGKTISALVKGWGSSSKNGEFPSSLTNTPYTWTINNNSGTFNWTVNAGNKFKRMCIATPGNLKVKSWKDELGLTWDVSKSDNKIDGHTVYYIQSSAYLSNSFNITVGI